MVLELNTVYVLTLNNSSCSLLTLGLSTTLSSLIVVPVMVMALAGSAKKHLRNGAPPIPSSDPTSSLTIGVVISSFVDEGMSGLSIIHYAMSSANGRFYCTMYTNGRYRFRPPNYFLPAPLISAVAELPIYSFCPLSTGSESVNHTLLFSTHMTELAPVSITNMLLVPYRLPSDDHGTHVRPQSQSCPHSHYHYSDVDSPASASCILAARLEVCELNLSRSLEFQPSCNPEKRATRTSFVPASSVLYLRSNDSHNSLAVVLGTACALEDWTFCRSLTENRQAVMPKEYQDIVKVVVPPLINSSVEELKVLLSKGVPLNGGKTVEIQNFVVGCNQVAAGRIMDASTTAPRL
ncbi:hypothetical protein Tco_0539772 [Tanacetum coccineum]